MSPEFAVIQSKHPPPRPSQEDGTFVKFNAPCSRLRNTRQAVPKAMFVSGRRRDGCSRKQPADCLSGVNLKLVPDVSLDQASHWPHYAGAAGASHEEKQQRFSSLKNLNVNLFKVNVCSGLGMRRSRRSKAPPPRCRPDAHCRFQSKVGLFWKTVVVGGAAIS